MLLSITFDSGERSCKRLHLHRAFIHWGIRIGIGIGWSRNRKYPGSERGEARIVLLVSVCWCECGGCGERRIEREMEIEIESYQYNTPFLTLCYTFKSFTIL